MNCPHCNQRISDTFLARHLAAKGGAKAKGAKKARTSEQAAAAARVRWAKARSMRAADEARAAVGKMPERERRKLLKKGMEAVRAGGSGKGKGDKVE